MKYRLTPIEIPLKDLPAEGREFVYTRESGELNAALKDLIQENAYEVAFRITPMGNTFDLRGTLKTSLNLACSLCAIDFKYAVEQKLHEILMVQKPLAKGEQLTKANHAHEWEASGPDYISLPHETFGVADYIHEIIGLAQPIRPLGKPDCDVRCENLSDSIRQFLGAGTGAGDGAPDPLKAKPFQVLEKIKFKS